MDVATAASFFDDQPILDAYSSAVLAYGQPDLYDSAERDSNTGFRRSVSVVPGTSQPARGCIKFESDNYVIGRKVHDFFQGSAVREHWVIHPSDGLMQAAASSVFLAAGTPTSLHGALSWIKDKKEELRTSDMSPAYDFYCHTSESLSPGMIIKTPGGIYYRLASAGSRSGGLLAAVAYQLGTTAKRTISYTAASTTYDPATGAYAAGTPANIAAFVEGYQTNYLYLNNAAEKFEKADMVVTVLKTAVATPKSTDRLTDTSGPEGALVYRIVDHQSDGALAWALHVRPV